MLIKQKYSRNENPKRVAMIFVVKIGVLERGRSSGHGGVKRDVGYVVAVIVRRKLSVFGLVPVGR